jgi:hypothetical protein
VDESGLTLTGRPWPDGLKLPKPFSPCYRFIW